MNTLNYKDYLITLEYTHSGVNASATSETDHFVIKFIDYTKTEIIKRVKTQCKFRASEGY